ncbi:hypothetical protein QUF88_18255 [Bacillus sp. DX1.1]|uniref:hypothetical protein n=1 Tax=unclassified Bacillus (in: firmicutes) TaxID=185979 RepID=UPI00257045B3|nr:MULTISPECIES: hypothetical protein [unclassified Bacillus (in: firmicutes)]MDM5155660.1 hypothetical protein [Bacillus sp. DX1.1]WJE79965.1 hypothetical protein QRE67_15785 [Bacillus sp. DX3.1]
MFKKVALSIASVAVAGSVLFASQTVTEAAYYPVQKTGSGLDIRTTPTINGTRTQSNIPDGTNLWLYCYVNGESYMGSKVWDYVDDNGYGGSFNYGYAPDYFIKTGSSKPVVGYCSF